MKIYYLLLETTSLLASLSALHLHMANKEWFVDRPGHLDEANMHWFYPSDPPYETRMCSIYDIHFWKW